MYLQYLFFHSYSRRTGKPRIVVLEQTVLLSSLFLDTEGGVGRIWQVFTLMKLVLPVGYTLQRASSYFIRFTYLGVFFSGCIQNVWASKDFH